MSAEWVETEQLAVNHRSLVDLELIVPTEIRLVVVPPGMDRIDKQIVFQDEVLLLGPTVHDAVRTNVVEEVRCGPRRHCAGLRMFPSPTTLTKPAWTGLLKTATAATTRLATGIGRRENTGGLLD